MPQTWTLSAPAKINLGLKITGVRPDGYHLLESLFAPIDLADTIAIIPSDLTQVTFKSENGNVLKIENDTVSKAVALFREQVPSTPTLKIEVIKRIPMGAGLGGGSSDAGRVLQFLQKTYGDERSASRVLDAAQRIGADTSFFLNPTPSLVSGIGEIVQPVSLENLDLVVCKPRFSVSTKDAYAWLDADSRLTHLSVDATSMASIGVFGSPQSSAANRIKASEVIKFLHNDLEKPVEARHQEIAVMKKALRQWGALGCQMSGSGSSVYGIFRNINDARAARENLQQDFPSEYSFFICRTLS